MLKTLSHWSCSKSLWRRLFDAGLAALESINTYCGTLSLRTLLSGENLQPAPWFLRQTGAVLLSNMFPTKGERPKLPFMALNIV